MARLQFGPAKKFLYNCQYLKGKEIDVRRRDGSVIRGTVIGFGACGSPRTAIDLWAKVQDNKTGQIIQVDLMSLYRSVPRGKEEKAVKAPVNGAIAEESLVSENAHLSSQQAE